MTFNKNPLATDKRRWTQIKKTKILVFSLISVYLHSSVAKILFRLSERCMFVEFIHIDFDTVALAFQKVRHRARQLRLAQPVQ